MANTKKGTSNSTAKKKTTAKNTTAKKTTKTAAKKTTNTKAVSGSKTKTTKQVSTKAAASKTTTAKKKSTSPTKVATATKSKKVVNTEKTPTKKESVKISKKVEVREKIDIDSLDKKIVSENPQKEDKLSSVKTKSVRNSETTSNLFTIIGISLLVVVIIVSCLVSALKQDDTDKVDDDNTVYSTVEQESESIKDSEKKELKSISIDDYLELLKSDTAQVIYIGRPTCSHCAVQKPLMENLVYKYNITINYLNTDDLDSEGISKLQSSNDYFKSGWGTPLTLIVKNNEIIDKASGETSRKDLVQLFKQYDIISE